VLRIQSCNIYDDDDYDNNNNNNNNNNKELVVLLKYKSKEIKVYKSKYRNSENVEHEMLCRTSNHWGHRNCKQKFTKISGNNTRTTVNRFPTKTAILGTSHIIRKVLQAET
jgi:hypothetical protein